MTGPAAAPQEGQGSYRAGYQCGPQQVAPVAYSQTPPTTPPAYSSGQYSGRWLQVEPQPLAACEQMVPVHVLIAAPPTPDENRANQAPDNEESHENGAWVMGQGRRRAWAAAATTVGRDPH